MISRVLVLILVFGSVAAAEFIKKDYPYDVYNDGGVIRYCMETTDLRVECWANGKAQMCDKLSDVQGYINCI